MLNYVYSTSIPGTGIRYCVSYFIVARTSRAPAASVVAAAAVAHIGRTEPRTHVPSITISWYVYVPDTRVYYYEPLRYCKTPPTPFPSSFPPNREHIRRITNSFTTAAAAAAML